MKKKLIEVALPLEAINKASAKEKSNPFLKGHPRNLHQWWARRPLAAARAVIFAQMVDDPSAHPEQFPTEEEQKIERDRLFELIEKLVQWENTTNEHMLNQARDEIWKSWRYTCEDNKNHPRAAELFNPGKLPAFHDPFAGGGSLPLEAQRLGLEAYASDLNPVAVLINKAMIEIPPKFANMPPVNPESRKQTEITSDGWNGAQGISEDVLYYGKWMHNEAEKRICHLYPKIEITKEMATERPDLKKYIGQMLSPIAWIWARTVKSPNPAFSHLEVPLVTTFMLTTRAGKEAYVEPVFENSEYRFTVKLGKPQDLDKVRAGTKLSRGAKFRCLMSGTPILPGYIKNEGQNGRIGTKLMAVVVEGERERLFLTPTQEIESISKDVISNWKPETPLPKKALGFSAQLYFHEGTYGDLFTPRQLVALTTFSELVQNVREKIREDAIDSGYFTNNSAHNADGVDSSAYADAISTFMALSLDKLADYNNTLCTWNPTNQNIGHLFTKQAIPMAWDFPETSPLDGGLSFDMIVEGISKTISQFPSKAPGKAFQEDCANLKINLTPSIYSTDPPYYDNIGYADLSDFFYVWLRHSLQQIFPDLFATLAVPKSDELIAEPNRHGGKEQAEIFFMNRMTQAIHRLAEHGHPAFPLTIYYAFKQSETEDEGTASTGWEIFLDAVNYAGLTLTGTWPMSTERDTRSRGLNSNALASSIVLVCRKRDPNALTVTRREFLTTLKNELPEALKHLQHSNIAPVDLAQAAIGPGMAVYTRYSKVLDAEGKAMTVREALALINQTLDEVLAEQEGDFDSDTRWALSWFEQYGFDMGEYGVAETLSKAKNTSVSGMVEAGILESKSGKVRMLKPAELPTNWDPAQDERLTVWEIVHHLIRVLESGGETAAAELVAKLGSKADTARELAYRLYVLCERKKRASEALSYNALVQSWPEIMRLAKGEMALPKGQMHLIEEEE